MLYLTKMNPDELPPGVTDDDCEGIAWHTCRCGKEYQGDDLNCPRCEDRADRAMEDREEERNWNHEIKQTKQTL